MTVPDDSGNADTYDVENNASASKGINNITNILGGVKGPFFHSFCVCYAVRVGNRTPDMHIATTQIDGNG